MHDIRTYITCAINLIDAGKEKVAQQKLQAALGYLKPQPFIVAEEDCPPNPEGINHERALWADIAIHAFMMETGADQDAALSDLLGDLMHWADRMNYDFDLALDRARGHYNEETAKVEDASCAARQEIL